MATQFSVLSHTFVKVRAPPVATLLFHLISSHRFSGHHLWRHSFLFLGHCRWRPFCHFLPPHHICRHRLVIFVLRSRPLTPTLPNCTYRPCLSADMGPACCRLTACGMRAKQKSLWRLSFLFCHAVCCVFRHNQLRLHREPELRPGRQNYDQGGRITPREAELRPGRQNYDHASCLDMADLPRYLRSD